MIFNMNEPTFFTFIQLLGSSVIGLNSTYKFSKSRHSNTTCFYTLAFTSVLLVLSMTANNFASYRLTYSTQSLFKSGKLIPLMIANMAILRKKFTLTEIISICVIVCGLIGVSLGDYQSRYILDPAGIIAIVFSLSLESIGTSLQEYLLKTIPQNEVNSILSLLGTLFALLLTILDGEFIFMCIRIKRDPILLLYFFVISVLSAFGYQFIYLSLKVFGSLQTVMFTCIRKALTLIYIYIQRFSILKLKGRIVPIMLILLGTLSYVYSTEDEIKENDNIGFLDSQYNFDDYADDELTEDPLYDSYE